MDVQASANQILSSIFQMSSGSSGAGGMSKQLLQVFNRIEKEIDKKIQSLLQDFMQNRTVQTPQVDATQQTPILQNETNGGGQVGKVTGGGGGGAGAGAGTGTVEDSTQTPAATPSGKTVSVDGGGPNSLTLVNNTDKPMTVAFFRNLAPGEHPSFNGPDAQFTIAAHSSINVSMPNSFQGRVQKYSGSTQDPSNWAEINFDGTGKAWYDESDILGRNSSIKITAPDGTTAGTSKSVLAAAKAAGVTTTDSSGETVVQSPQWFDGKTNQAAVNFLDQNIGTNNAYVLPNDNNAVRTSETNTLTVEFGNA